MGRSGLACPSILRHQGSVYYVLMLRLPCPTCSTRIPIGAVAPPQPNYRGVLFAQGQQVVCPNCKSALEPVPWTMKLAMLLTVLVSIAPIAVLASFLKTASAPSAAHPQGHWWPVLAVPFVIALSIVLRAVAGVLIVPRLVRLRTTYNPQDPLGGDIR
jgi:hypothetical protein